MSTTSNSLKSFSTTHPIQTKMKKPFHYYLSVALATILLGYMVSAGPLSPNFGSQLNANGLRTSNRSPANAPPPPSQLPTVKSWKSDQAPGFCSRIIENPRPLPNDCRMNYTSNLCVDGKATMFSQMHQDFYLWTKHFSKMKRRGIYLDIAANQPVHISNTYFMDACLGWSGLCVEGNPQLLADLYRQRSCAILPTCVSDRDGISVQFALYNGASGIVSTNKNMEQWTKHNMKVPVIRQKCTTMKIALKKHEIVDVDYLSLDVEGHEMQVLKGIDWDSVKIKVMTIEGNDQTHAEIEEFLKDKGYVRHTIDYDERARRSNKLWEDAIFLHSSVEFGKPM